jgi:hypothetical protein
MNAQNFVIARQTEYSQVAERMLKQINFIRVGLPERVPERVTPVVVSVIRKLDAVRANLKQLDETVTSELSKFMSPSSMGDAMHANLATGAEHAFEGVLLQAKASLDVLTTALLPLTSFRGGSFSDAGRTLSNMLRNNAPADKRERGSALADWLDLHRPWLHSWIDEMRDDVAHRRPVRSTGFVYRKIAPGAVFISEPRLPSGETLREYAEDLAAKLPIFAEELFAGLYSYALRPGFALARDPRGDNDPREPRYQLGVG